MLLRSLLLSSIFSLPLIAQAQLAGVPVHPTQGVWIEVKINVNQNKGFQDAIQDSAKTTGGVGVELGWQPLLKTVNSSDSVLGRALKSMGLSFGAAVNGRPSGFNNYLYSYETCSHDGRYYTDDDGYTYYDDGCTTNSVYARDAYVKYEAAHITFGAYIPFELAKRLQVAGGVVVKFHSINETYRTDESYTSWKTSVSAVLKLTYLFTDNVGLVGSYQHSVAGYKNRSFSIGVIIRW